MNIGKKIKLLRKENNMTQKELALKIDVSPPTVTKYENGQLEPNLNILVKISQLFNISIDDLLEINISVKDNFTQNSTDSDALVKSFIIHVIKTSNIDIKLDSIDDRTKILMYNLTYASIKSVLDDLVNSINKGDAL